MRCQFVKLYLEPLNKTKGFAFLWSVYPLSEEVLTWARRRWPPCIRTGWGVAGIPQGEPRSAWPPSWGWLRGSSPGGTAGRAGPGGTGGRPAATRTQSRRSRWRGTAGTRDASAPERERKGLLMVKNIMGYTNRNDLFKLEIVVNVFNT